MPPNPFTPPHDTTRDTTRTSPPERRSVYLILPPIVPFGVHFIVRSISPPKDDETLYHALVIIGPVVVALIWAQSMLDRLHLPLWKSFLLACFVWSVILASSVLSYRLSIWTFR